MLIIKISRITEINRIIPFSLIYNNLLATSIDLTITNNILIITNSTAINKISNTSYKVIVLLLRYYSVYKLLIL